MDCLYYHSTITIPPVPAPVAVLLFAFPEPPLPIDFMLMGDFNFVPGSQEYLAMLGDGELVDATVTDPSLSYFDPQGIHPSQRLDFCFANVELATRVRQCRIDVAAEGSDHRPVWVTIA
jgi:endonuclease/exonuclease/phosphatase family metal-dependent hydrolase